jgi:hypothetical protein
VGPGGGVDVSKKRNLFSLPGFEFPTFQPIASHKAGYFYYSNSLINIPCFEDPLRWVIAAVYSDGVRLSPIFQDCASTLLTLFVL